MGVPKPTSTEINVKAIAESLPQTRAIRTVNPIPSNNDIKQMPSSLPQCFYQIWKRRQSSLPAHRRERAALEAVASTMPKDILNLTGSAAAAAYLGALTISLNALIQNTSKISHQSFLEIQNDQKITSKSKTQRKKQRKSQKIAEKQVEQMKSSDLPHSNQLNDAEMDDDDDDDQDNDSDENSNMIASLLYLIGLAITGSSPAVINSKSEQLLSCVMLTYDTIGAYAAVARHTPIIFMQVLSNLTPSMWSKPYVQRTFQYLLKQTTDHDAKARRKARESMDTLQQSSRASLICRKTSNATAIHYTSQLKLYANAINRQDIKDDLPLYTRARSAMIHLLTSIDRFVLFLEPTDMAKVSKELVVVAMQASQDINIFAFSSLASIFKHRQTSTSKKTNLNQETEQIILSAMTKKDLEKLVDALLQYELVEDASDDLIIAYLNCIMQASLAHITHFPIANAPMQFINTTIQRHILLSTKNVSREQVIRALFENLNVITAQPFCTAKPEVLEQFLLLIKQKYKTLWSAFAKVLRNYLERDMTSGHVHTETPVTKIIQKLLKIRSDGINSRDKKTTDFCEGSIASIIKGGGCERLLRNCEIKYHPKDHVTNSWLLPILSQNLAGAPFHIFYTHFFPLAKKLRMIAKKVQDEKRVIEAKNIGIYVMQVIGLIQGFCKKPSDLGHGDMLNHAFGVIFLCLTDEERLCILHGSTALRNLAISISGLDKQDPIALTKVSAFAKRFKKIFPTISEVTFRVSDNNRDNLLQTITSGCQACNDPTMVSQFLRKTIKSLLQLQIEISTSKGNNDAMDDESREDLLRNQHAALDIAIAVISSKVLSSDIEEIKYLQQAIRPFLLDSKNSSLQRKAYRVLTVLVQAGALKSIETEIETFLKGISDVSNSVAAGAKAARFKFLAAVIDLHLQLNPETDKTKFLLTLNSSFLSEIVVGTRDNSDKTRTAAFETLVTMARAWNTSSSGTNTDGLCQFIISVAAGLGGRTVSMLSASLTALGRLIYEFRGEMIMSQQLTKTVDSLFGNVQQEEESDDELQEEKDTMMMTKAQVIVTPGPVAILLRHKVLEVQKAALGVVKIATKVLSEPIDRLLAVLPAILPGLVHAAASSKKQDIRLRVRVILERLLRKCGREVLEANFPEDHLKLLSSVRKKYSRDLVKKHADKEAKKLVKQLKIQTRKITTNSADKFDMEDIGLDESDSDIEKELLDGDDLLANQRKMLTNDQDKAGDGKNTPGQTKSGVGKQGNTKKTEVQSRLRNDGIKFTDDGKPIIVESSDESGEVEIGSSGSVGEDSTDDERDVRVGQFHNQGSKKRQRSEDTGGLNEKKMKGSYGEEFKSRRGDGDVKRTGRPDPYAYVPLGMNMMGGKKGGSSLHKLSNLGGKKKGKKGPSLKK